MQKTNSKRHSAVKTSLFLFIGKVKQQRQIPTAVYFKREGKHTHTQCKRLEGWDLCFNLPVMIRPVSLREFKDFVSPVS